MIDVRGSRAAIRKAYDLFSHFYGFTVTQFEKPAIAKGLVQAGAQAGEYVLDAGCGAGNALAHFHRAVSPGGLAVGIDMAPLMLGATRQRVPDLLLVRGEIGQLPLATGSFDLLWSSYVLDLIPANELGLVLSEFRRVLRPGGRLVLVAFTKHGEKLTWWERAYLHTPPWLVPYVFGSCRPVFLAPYVEAAGFVSMERQIVPHRMYSEIITARKPAE